MRSLVLVFFLTFALNVNATEKKEIDALIKSLPAGMVEKLMADAVESSISESNLTGQYEITYREKITKLFGHPEYQRGMAIRAVKHVKNKTSPEAKRLAGRKFAQAIRDFGFKFSTAEELVIHHDLITKILTKSSESECAQIIKKQPPDLKKGNRSLVEIASELPIKDFESWLKVSFAGQYRALDREKMRVKVSDEDSKKYSKAYYITYLKYLKSEPGALDRFRSVMSAGFAESSDADVCRVGREMLGVMSAFKGVHKEKVIQSFVEGSLSADKIKK